MANFRLAHFSGVAFVVKEYEAANPLNVSLLRAQAQMSGAQNRAHFMQEFLLSGRRFDEARMRHAGYNTPHAA